MSCPMFVVVFSYKLKGVSMEEYTKKAIKEGSKSLAKIAIASVIFPPAAAVIAGGELMKHCVGAVGGKGLGKVAKAITGSFDADDVLDDDYR